MRYKTRKRLALLVLVVGLPIYTIVAVTLMSGLMNSDIRLPIGLELLAYVALGVGWAIPLRWIFKGIGQPDPDGDP